MKKNMKTGYLKKSHLMLLLFLIIFSLFCPKSAFSKEYYKAIVVAGSGPYEGNNLWDATKMTANYAYSTFVWGACEIMMAAPSEISPAASSGGHDLIYYLSAATDTDIDNDGYSDVNADATNANLEYAIKTWGRDAENLFIFLTGHGGNGVFRIGEFETLNATDLDQWLDALQETMPGNVIVLYDAPYAGSFLPALIPEAGKQRVVVASAGFDETAIFMADGALSFGFQFFVELINGSSFYEAYVRAKRSIELAYDQKQNPEIDANGNGIGNEQADQEIASSLHLCFMHPPDLPTGPPIINGVSFKVSSEYVALSGLVNPNGLETKCYFEYGKSNNYGINTSEVLIGAGREDRKVLINIDELESGETYHFRLVTSNSSGETLGKDIQFVNEFSKAIIVAGGGNYENHELWPAIKSVCSDAFETLNSYSYSKELIYLLSSDFGLDSDADAKATVYDLRYAITDWATDAKNLLIYMVGHGTEKGLLQLDIGEVLTATELDSWLDEAQEQIPGDLVVVMDSCYSGSFLQFLKPQSGKQRLFISSCSANEQARFLGDGRASFSWFFWAGLMMGDNFYDAFLTSRDELARIHVNPNTKVPIMNPQLQGNWLDDPNEKTDEAFADSILFGQKPLSASDIPWIGEVSEPQTLAGGKTSALLFAEDVFDMDGIGRVYADIIPPDVQLEVSLVSWPTITLTLVDEGKELYEPARYEVTYEGFSKTGDYNIVMYAVDTKGNWSRSKQTTVTVAPTPDSPCLVVGTELGIKVPSVEYNGKNYGFLLDFYPHPDGIEGFYWKLIIGSLTTGTGTYCIPIGSDLSMPMDCVSYNGKQYGFTLERYSNPYDPSGLYWVMDKSTLTLK